MLKKQSEWCKAAEKIDSLTQERENMKQKYTLGPNSIKSNNFIRFPELRNNSPSKLADGDDNSFSQTLKSSYLADRLNAGSASYAALPLKQHKESAATLGKR